MAPRFIHLHNHSEYSVLDGAIRVSKLPELAKSRGMAAVALTDHGNVFGAVAFAKAAKKAGIKPIIGSEVYVAPGRRFDKEARDQAAAHYHLLLLVKDEVGYRNLCVLLSKAYTEGFYYRPRVDKDLLAEHAAGLIALSGCLKGEAAFWLSRDQEEAAARAAGQYAEIFGRDGFYIELMDHGLAPQKDVNPKLVRLARALNLPLAATNDCHYAEKDDAESHDALLCIQTNKKISDPDRIKFGSQEFYFKTADEMAALFGEVPEALEATYEIASRCDFTFPKDQYFLPRYDPPDGRTLSAYFEEVARQGFESRLQALRPRLARGESAHGEAEYEERFERELRLVGKMGFEGYFLIVWDLLKTARAKDIPVGPGRGSAAGSLLAYSLRITDIDPIEYGLLFERFLNPERISLPDIDMDFCARRREEMIRYVRERYGADNVCQIITFGTMAARAAIRDVGRVLEVPLSEVDKIAKMIPFAPGQEVTIESALRDVPALRDLSDRNSKIAHLLALAQKVEGQVRNPSIHAAGVVITPRPLTEFVPLYQSVKGEVTTQFAMKDVESIGLLKMDLLGLRNLTIIRDALDIIERDTGARPDVDSLPLDDARVFSLFQAAATDGVFQFESPGMKNLLRRYKPDQFRDLIALNALFRPGPLKSGMTERFILRKNSPEAAVDDMPILAPILQETRGLIVYQEQVMLVTVLLAGFTMAQADVLRKAMGKKDKDLMKQQKALFLAGVKATKSAPAAAAGKLFDQIQEFAEYCFNKSHSAAYAALAYQTAWLKAHYPRHFMAALISSEAERGATAQVVKYINECKAMGIEVLPPDINASDFSFAVHGNQIRFGLSAIKNVGETAARALVDLRRERGAFASPFDVVRDADTRVVNRRVLESLIKAGAFDSLGMPRSQGYHLLDALIRFNHEAQRAKTSRQTSLFGGETEAPPIPDEVRALPEWGEAQMLAYEKEALGFYITGHPLAELESTLRRLASHFVADLDEERDFGSEVTLAGIIQDFKNLKTKKEEQMASFSLEDLTGRVEVVAFPDVFRQHYDLIREDNKVWLKGKFIGEGESRKIQLTAALLLDDAMRKMASRVVLKLRRAGLDDALLDEMRQVLEKNLGDCPLYFELETAEGKVVTVQSPDVKGLNPSPEAVKALEALLGPDTVAVSY